MDHIQDTDIVQHSQVSARSVPLSLQGINTHKVPGQERPKKGKVRDNAGNTGLAGMQEIAGKAITTLAAVQESEGTIGPAMGSGL